MRIGKTEIGTGWIVLGAVLLIAVVSMQPLSQEAEGIIITTDTYTDIQGVGWRLVEVDKVATVALKNPDGTVTELNLPAEIAGLRYTYLKRGRGVIEVKIERAK